MTEIMDDDVKMRNGFSDKHLMVVFIIVVCSSDHGKMTRTVFSLT